MTKSKVTRVPLRGLVVRGLDQALTVNNMQWLEDNAHLLPADTRERVLAIVRRAFIRGDADAILLLPPTNEEVNG